MTQWLSLGGRRRGHALSTEAVMQIKRLITALARTVDALDAAKNRPRADADDLDTRRRNLMVTIASLEDRLDCIEKVRSREYGAHANLAVPALTSHGFTERGFFDFSHVLEGPLR